jgi:hypothetical protein
VRDYRSLPVRIDAYAGCAMVGALDRTALQISWIKEDKPFFNIVLHCLDFFGVLH